MPKWTLKALKEHIDTRLHERDEGRKEEKLDLERRFAGTNEWRRAFDDLTKTMASQEALDSIVSRVKRLEDAEIKSGGKSAGIGMISAIAFAVLGAVGTVFTIAMVAINGAG